MKTPDKLPEVRRSKVVLWTVAISAVVTLVGIGVKKILDSVDQKSQKPVVEASEKTGEDRNQEKKPAQDSGSAADDASPAVLIEDDEFIGDCKPTNLKEACAILKDADVNSVQCDIYTAVDQAFAFSHEGETLKERWSYDVSDVFDECGLNEEEQKKVLREGIQQGDTDIGAFVREEWIGRKCNGLYQESSDYKKNEDRYSMEREACEEMPADITLEDLKKVDDAECKAAQKSQEKFCEENEYPFVCKIEAQDGYRKCVNALLPGPSYEVAKKTQGTSLYCFTEARRRQEERDAQWIKQCHRNLSGELGVELEDVEFLYKARQAEDFMRMATERSGCDEISDYINALYWLDIKSPDVLDILGVKNQDDILSQYIEGEVEECVLTQYDQALGFCDMVTPYTSCSWSGLEIWQYGGMYSKMGNIKKGKYPLAGRECTKNDIYCNE